MRFEVFRNGKRLEKFALHGAYLFGGDGIAVRRCRIEFKNGFIECKKPQSQATGLALLWQVDGFGKVLLPTTCLPERDEPYNLNLEIARAKLMQIVSKREDWSFFDSAGLGRSFKQAQELLIAAFQNISDTQTASVLADRSLQKAIVFSEQLTNHHAQNSFEIKSNSQGFSRASLGCKIDTGRIDEPQYINKLVSLFGFVTVPINWARIEPNQGDYDFSSLDVCVAAASKHRLAIGAGPLLRFSEDYLPGWLINSGWGFEKIRDTAYRFVSKIVSRYSSTIRIWRIVSCLNVLNHFGFNFEQVVELSRAANMAVKAASERTVKIIEICNPWGEYYATEPNTIPPLVYLDMIAQSGMNFDAFGLQIRFGKDCPGMHMRDIMQMSAVLDYFAVLAKPLYITEVEIPGQSGTGMQDENAAGIWHKQWDQQQQSLWLENFYKIAISKPFIDTITYSHLADTPGSAVAGSGLLTAELEPKKAYRTLSKLKQQISGK